ncbi:hypothetical protein UlMin_033081 [Ulmus minor]
MAFFHRKLFPSNMTEEDYCEKLCEKDVSVACLSDCWNFCPKICIELSKNFSPPPPISSHKSHKPSTFLTITIALLAASFLVICGYIFYVKYFSNSNNPRRRSTRREAEANPDEFLDEEHGPVIDHPIWYIRTVGLQPSIISSITALKYKRDDGIVEGTECSVCLSEFQEDESLRLLPKCSHAFHISCIDTWLRSHTNCPMCRAPIVVNTVRTTVALPEPGLVSSSSEEETQAGDSGNNREVEREMEDGVCESRVGSEEEGENSNCEVGSTQPSRRSVSLDSSSALKISLCVSKVAEVESATKRVEENQKLQRLNGSSSRGRASQREAVSMKRSFSYSGKFGLCRQSKSSDSVLPLRSF